MRYVLISAGLIVSLSACSVVPDGLFGVRAKPEAAAPLVDESDAQESGEEQIPEDARTVEEFDTTSDAERQDAIEAAESVNSEADLGLTIASLGAVTEPGIWLKTPLVKEAGKGRVVFPEEGTTVAVDLIPLEGEPGAGSRLSLAAMRLLEVDLTSLPEIRVYRSN